MNDQSPPPVANEFAPTPAGHRALRRARVSVFEASYFTTACTDGRRPALESDEAAVIVFDTLHALETVHGVIQLVASVVMPDHVHLVFELRAGTVAAVMKRFRGASARLLNEVQGATGSVWQRGYFEHRLRRDDELTPILNYLWHNPSAKPGRHFRCRAEVWAWFRTGIDERAEDYDWLKLSS